MTHPNQARYTLAAVGPKHEQTIRNAKRLVKLYEVWGKPDKAAEWRANLPKNDETESAKP